MKRARVLSCLYAVVFISVLLTTITGIATEDGLSEAPVLISSPIINGKEGMPYVYEAKAIYSDSDILKYSLLDFPEGMNIGASTGLINWLPTSPGSFEVILEAADREKTISTTQRFTIIVEKALLTSIEVLPSTVMYLGMNESKTIKSVTAYYDNDNSKEIDISNCSYESDNPDIATVDNSGTIKGVTNIISIAATITVSYSENHISKSDTILVVVNPPFIVFEGMDQACAF